MAAQLSRKRRIALGVMDIIEEALKQVTNTSKLSQPAKTCKCSKCGYWHYPVRT